MVNRTPVILVFAFSQLIPGSAWARGYFMEDFQYFKPIIADVRASHNHLRLYRAGEVPFSNSTSEGDHWFVDASFGGRFHFLGYNLPTTNQEPFRTPGVSMFVEGASHLLLDLNTESSSGSGEASGGIPTIRSLPAYSWTKLRTDFSRSTCIPAS